MKDLSDKLQTNISTLACKQRNVEVLKMLARHLDAYMTGTPLPTPTQQEEQRVDLVLTQRVGDMAHPSTHSDIQRVSNKPVMQLANNQMSTQVLQTKMRTHQCLTR